MAFSLARAKRVKKGERRAATVDLDTISKLSRCHETKKWQKFRDQIQQKVMSTCSGEDAVNSKRKRRGNEGGS